MALGKEKQSSRRRRLGWSLCRGPSPGALGKELFFFKKKSLPRASNHGPRQRNVQNFSKKSLTRAMGRPSAKNYSFFLKKIFAEGLQPWPSAKKCCRNFIFFKKKTFAEGNGTALGKGPFFAEGLGHCPRQRGRNLNFFLFFAFHRHKHFIYIHIYITQNLFSHNISQP